MALGEPSWASPFVLRVTQRDGEAAPLPGRGGAAPDWPPSPHTSARAPTKIP